MNRASRAVDELARQTAEARKIPLLSPEEAEKARKAREERAAQQAKAEAELKLLADRREAERLRAEAEAAARAAMEAEANNPGFVAKLGQGLSRSSSRLAEGLAALGRRKLDDETLEELEDLLITSDLGAKVAARVAASLSKERFDKEITEEEIRLALASEISEVMKPREKIVDFSEGTSPRIVLFVGVNGSGKTTTIGKIASKLSEQGARALLVAGDTFRAAAIEQLTVWGDRAGIPVMSKPTGADAAGLVYEAIERAKAEDLDLVLI
ncbi:MAG: signal recognition particle-docking protein FtsY, partial [Hyphomonas sp. 32-62-5]